MSKEYQINPKIIIGVCRDTFSPQTDVNRTNDTLAINLATGDILSNKKWKDYYSVDRQPYPLFGYF